MSFEGDKISDIPAAELRLEVIQSGGGQVLAKNIAAKEKKSSTSLAMLMPIGGLAHDGAYVVSAMQMISMDEDLDSETSEIVIQKIRIDDGESMWRRSAPLKIGGPDAK